MAMSDCRCGHPATHHAASRCWTRPDGHESWHEVPGQCACTGYQRSPTQ